MQMVVDFKFEPLQKVTIHTYGLNYEGRIIRCEYDGHTKNYSVEYAFDGKLDQRIFFEDQLA
jgi:hypothetical protein